MTPADFPRAFAIAFGMRDAERLTQVLAEDVQVLTLTGATAEGRVAARAVLAAEFAGIFARARLVTGRMQMQPLAATVCLLNQRFVVSGALGPDGRDLPRFAALLTVVLVTVPTGWQAACLTFSGLAE